MSVDNSFVRFWLTSIQLAKMAELMSGINPENPQGKEQVQETYIIPLRVLNPPLITYGADVGVQDHHEKLETYAQMVEDTIDLDELQNHNYVLLPTIDNELQVYRDRLINVRDQLDEEHRRVGEDLNVDIEKKLHLENHQVYNYSFRITKAVSTILPAG